MSMNDALLMEFVREMSLTRKTLERVPDDKLGWKPHEKSGTMGWLAGHLANLPGWATMTISKDSLDIHPPGEPEYKMEIPKSRQALLDLFDRNFDSGRDALTGASDDWLEKPWTLLNGGQKVFTMPRAAVLRTMVLNHNIHHRAQLGVYLRLNDIPVPGVLGPSADEQPM